MVKKHLPGISTVEIIIVLAISSMMFVVAVGFFSTRTRTAQDDAARLVVSEVAKVRNEAQQGLGPSSTGGADLLKGNELFGQAIEFDNNQMVVYKLMKTSSDRIKAYETYTIPLTQQLKWWVIPGAVTAGFCAEFNSCYDAPGGAAGYNRLYNTPVNLTGSEKLLAVFKNNTGESYVFARKNPADSITSDLYLGEVASKVSNYSKDRQGQLKVAYAVPGPGSTEQETITNAPVQYYLLMDLSIPNDQRLEVVK